MVHAARTYKGQEPRAIITAPNSAATPDARTKNKRGAMFVCGDDPHVVAQTTPPVGPCFRRNFIPRRPNFRKNHKRGFLTTTQSYPQLGLVEGSRGPTQVHIRGLCHWAGEPAGHLGADSPGRRAAEHASAKRTKPPSPHWLRGLSQAHHVNAVSRHRRVPPFASSRHPLTHALSHLQWQEPPRFIDASATSRASIKEPSRPRAVRPPGRYGRVRAIRDSPSDVDACHRVVRRHTCSSPVTR